MFNIDMMLPPPQPQELQKAMGKLALLLSAGCIFPKQGLDHLLLARLPFLQEAWLSESMENNVPARSRYLRDLSTSSVEPELVPSVFLRPEGSGQGDSREMSCTPNRTERRDLRFMYLNSFVPKFGNGHHFLEFAYVFQTLELIPKYQISNTPNIDSANSCG